MSVVKLLTDNLEREERQIARMYCEQTELSRNLENVISAIKEKESIVESLKQIIERLENK